MELRRAISTYVEANYTIGYRPDDEIIVTVGVSEAIDLALRALINPGDKVLYHQPCYVSYHPSVALAHGVAIAVPTRAEDGFALNVEDLEKAWQPGCKVLMVNLPCNPTGGTCDRARLEKIARFAVEKDLIVLSDEIYSELVYDGAHTSIAVFPGHEGAHDLPARVLEGLRDDRVPDRLRLRAGGADRRHDEGPPVLDALRADPRPRRPPSRPWQRGEDGVKSMREQYHRRRDLVVRRLNAAGLNCRAPGGAFYVFPSVAATGLGERDFAYGLLEAQKVAVVPGSAFGENGRGFVRASFATGYDQLVEACDRIERFVNTATPCSAPSSS